MKTYNIDRSPDFYHDESGERFIRLFQDAEDRRSHFWNVFYICACTVSVCAGLVGLYILGRIIGL